MPNIADQRTHLMLENYIGGKFLPCTKYVDAYDPSVGEVYCKVPDSDKEEVDAAVKAAKEAFPAWSCKSPQERSQVLNKLADLIDAHREEFAQAESKDQGKTLTYARTVDIPRSAYNFRFFASSILHHTTECTQMDHMGCMHYTVRTPVGVAGLISPWNFPLYLLTWKIAPAIAMGNTVVAKPSEMTSVTAWMMCKLLDEAGEICLCTSRIFVQKGIFNEFLQRFVEAARKWKTGVPLDATANMGALISKEHLEKVKGYVTIAQTEGGKVLCGEGVSSLDLPVKNQTGYFMLPTVITGVADESRCMQEEIFGPVTCVVPFENEEEVIQRANNVKYGLGATVWSRDVGRVHRVAKKLQAGMVWTNCWLIRDLSLPFGGMKFSGVGREGGKDSFEFFTEVKTITIKH